ncbi:nitroreductase family protein [Methanococcoides sp. AM1]|uniref:nitroreductase family protein n=1 Tax=Methanococcoides sp. AM1 TaxID=1201011 RepID=UPI001083CF77|nr:nitroreductase family protein [Methanococcoides sp. AM1]
MNVISIEPELCTNCEICVEICPMSIILPPKEGGTPYSPEDAATYCAKCGHCEVFCPEGAISTLFDSTYYQLEDDEFPSIDPSELGKYMVMRRSIRSYRDESVDTGTIEKILDISRYAPSGMNKQPVHWTIVHDPEEVKTITGLSIEWMREVVASEEDHPLKPLMPGLISSYEMGVDPICRGAPHLVIAHTPSDNPTGYTDSIIALSWFELAAQAFELGTCWAGFLAIAAASYKPLMDELELPQGHVVQYSMMFGYPEHEVKGIPGREPARVTWK